MRQAKNRIEGLPPSDGAKEPTVGSIKRVLHELSLAASGSAQRDNGANLRDAYDLLRRLALRNGIDPDDALRQRLAAVELLRERMVLASATISDRETPR